MLCPHARSVVLWIFSPGPMARGMAPSKNALVEQASNKELRELQRQARQRRWQEGAKDTLLLKDVEDVETAFLCRTDIIPIA